MLHCTIDIKRLESEADEVLDKTLAELFDGVGDVPGIIKALHWEEVYQHLEDAADRCEDIANTLERIVVKNA